MRFTDDGVTVSGGVSLGSGGVRFLPGRPISGTITDRLGPEPGESPPLAINTDAVRATLVFADGKIEAFKFTADTLKITLGSIVTINAVDFTLDTGALGDPDRALVSFLSVGAEVKIGSLVIGGEARNFAFMGDGSFQTRPGFGVFLSVGGATGDSFKWPSWLPIRIDEIGITWRDIQADPLDFAIILSASIAGMPAVPGLTFTGSIEGVKIDIGKLLDGEFPITEIAAIAVTVQGDLFGGQINAGLVGGILKLSAGGQVIDTFDVLTPVAERVFFIGVQGGFEFAGLGGFQIRFAMSELGPLGVFISVNIPGGILLEPNTGLSINDFAAGVDFFKTLPSIEDPIELRRPEFNVQTVVTAENWLEDIKAQVARQYLAIKANPSRNGFMAAFTAPMTITGSAKIYTAYASEAVFNGQVNLKFSTDGKILVAGKLNFAADNISMSGKLYADLSRISRGEATVLFLADIPDQVRILTIQGKLKMGFRNPSGEEVEFTVPELPPLTPTAVIQGPAQGGEISLSELNGRGYVDIAFETPSGHRIEESTILDFGDEFTLQQGATPVELDSTQPPIFLRVDGTKRIYRYFVLGGTPGAALTVTSINDSWVAVNLSTGEKIPAPTAPTVATGGNGVGVRYIDVGLAPMSGNDVDVATVGANDFTLGGAGAGITIDGAITPTRIPNTNIFRYYLSGPAFTTGDVTVSFAAGGWRDTDGPSSASTGHFSVSAPSAAVTGPFVPGGRIGVTTINVFRFNGSLYIDIVFTPSPGADLDYASILDSGDEFELRIDNAEVDVNGTPTPIEIVQDDATGLMEAEEFVVTGTPEAVQQKLSDAGIQQFRYLLEGITDHAPGLVEIEFLTNSWMDTRGDGPTTQDIVHARIDGPTASLVDLAGQSIDANRFNGRGFIDVTIPYPIGGLLTIDRATVTDSDAEFVLSGPGVGTVALDGSQAPIFLRADSDADVFRYYLTGEFALGLDVTLELLYGSWETSDGNPSQAPHVVQTQTATPGRASST